MKNPLNNMKAPEGWLFLVMLAGYWGKADTPLEAFKKARSCGASDRVLNGAFDLYLVHPSARLDDSGMNITRDTGAPASVLVGSFRVTK